MLIATGLYNSFAALASAQIEGIDYQRTWRSSPISTLLHLAIHGGGIEQGASELASAAPAGGVHDFYTFDGIKQANNSDLHLTSTSFDDPRPSRWLRATLTSSPGTEPPARRR